MSIPYAVVEQPVAAFDGAFGITSRVRSTDERIRPDECTRTHTMMIPKRHRPR